MPEGGGTISKLPLGLLGFLGLKNGGQYPRSLGSSYDPSLDLLPLLVGANFEEFNPAQIAVPAAGNAGSFSAAGVSVPQTEVWYVTYAAIRSFTAAAEAWTGYLALRRFPVTSPNVVHPLTETVSNPTASILGVPGICRYYPMVWGPGDEVVGYTLTVTGTPTMRLALRFARFPI